MFRNRTRKLILDLLSLASSPKGGIHILNGHFISLDNETSSDVFKNLLEKLIESKVQLINFPDAVSRIAAHDISPDQCYVAFTFDDGFEECFTKIAPVLDQFGIKGGFFINPNFVDCNEHYRKNYLKNIVFTDSDKKPMTWKMIRELNNNGHLIGSHTLDHCRLNSREENYEIQIAESKRVIEEKLNAPCNYFAYTYGRIRDFSPFALEIAGKYHQYIFSQDDARHYFSFNGRVINRRHFEGDWNYRHVLFFLQKKSPGL